MGRIRQPIGRKWATALGIVGVAAMCLVYEFLSHRQHVRNPTDTTIPNISQLIDGFAQICTPRENDLRAAFDLDEDEAKGTGVLERFSHTWFFQDGTATYGRLATGLAWGCAISVVLGVLMGCYEWFAALLLPTLSFLSKVPGTAMLAVFFVMAGTGESMFTVMIGFGVLPTLTQSVYLSAKHDLHDEEVNKAYTLGASSFEVIWNVVVRQTLPKIIDNIRLQLGPAMVYLIAAEMLVGQVGIGYQIRMQQRLLNMAVVYDYIILLGLTGLLMDRGMYSLTRYLCPWHERN
jgi:NitT/TauT family transport system permease protein